MRLFIIFILTGSFLVGANQPTKTLALLDLTAPGMDRDQVLMITERLRTELNRTGEYIVVNRDELRNRLGKEDFHQIQRCHDTPCIIEYGQKLMTDFVVTGNVREFGRTLVIILRMVDLTSKKVTNIVTKRFEGNPAEINPVLAEASRQLARMPLAKTPSAAEAAETTETGPPEVKKYDPVRYAVGLLRYTDGSLRVYKDHYAFESKSQDYQVLFAEITHMEYVSLYDEKQRLQEALLVVYTEQEGKKKFTYIDFGLDQAKEFSGLVGCNLYVKNQVHYGGDFR